MKKNNKVTLAIDTSGKILKIALNAGGKTLTASKKTIKQEQFLFTLSDTLLTKVKLKFKDVDNICVIKGPGRFTGIRVGLTLAAIMQKFNKSNVFSINLLDAVCFQAGQSREFKKHTAKNPKAIISCVVHAFRDEYYLRFYTPGLKPKGKPLWMSKEQINECLAKQKAPVIAAGWAKDNNPLPTVISVPGLKFLKHFKRGVTASTLIKMLKEKMLIHKNLKPLYLKKARFEN